MIIKTKDGKIHHGEMGKTHFSTIEGSKIPVKLVICECFRVNGTILDVPLKW